jgi:hypothetical protein
MMSGGATVDHEDDPSNRQRLEKKKNGNVDAALLPGVMRCSLASPTALRQGPMKPAGSLSKCCMPCSG